MCGVAGAFFGDSKSATAIVELLNQRQFHRGPDSSHILAGDWYALGHTRLTINGLGNSGDQPFLSRCGRWLVVFNGEIYNHKKLRAELNHPLLNASDGAVIPELLSTSGISGLKRLQGMYAIVALDLWRAQVTLAVDGFGIKPLFWYFDQGNLIVASEPMALAECIPGIRPDMAALGTFLRRGSMAAHQSGLVGVERVPPGNWLTLGRRGLVNTGSTLSFVNAEDSIGSWSEVASAFQESVAAHLMSDVPIALLMSDGVDSTALAVAAAREGVSITGFTVNLGGGSRREDRGARKVADSLGMAHLAVDVVVDDFSPDRFFGAMQRPTIDGLNTFVVTQAAHLAGFKVALSGLGADELLTGYASQAELLGFGVLRGLPLGARYLVSKWNKPSSPYANSAERWHSLRSSPNVTLEEAYVAFRRQVWNAEFVSALLVELNPYPDDESIQRLKAVRTRANRLSVAQLHRYTASQLLPDTDAFSMTHSVEVRVPFLDSTLVSHVFGIPKRSLGKRHFVEAMDSDILRESLRRPKQGFSLPMEEWMRRGMLNEYVERLHDIRSPIYGVVEPQRLNMALEMWEAARVRWYRIWSLVALNEWLSRFR